MKTKLLLLVLGIGLIAVSCDQNTYSGQREQEDKLIENFLNRNGFNINAGYIFEECIQAQAALSVIFIDVDGLKIINDTYGHSEGDFTIKAVSETIELSCGSMDVCGRIGGDEFVIIGRGKNFADIFKKRFDAELERKNQEMNKPYELSASVGFINAIPDKSDTLIEFIQQADAEMYLVKKARKKQRI